MAHFALPSEHEIMLTVLGVFANAAKLRDRRPEGHAVVHKETGLPVSANDLRPSARAVWGEELALSLQIPPRALARSMVLRDDPEDPLAPGIALSTIDPDQWDADETEAVRTLTFRIKKVVHDLGRKGYFVLNAPGLNEEAIPLGEDGLTVGFKITLYGLQEAKRRIRGTKYDGSPQAMSILAVVGAQVLRDAPAWAQAEFRSGMTGRVS